MPTGVEKLPDNPFDRLAARYDAEAADAPINRWLRGRVWNWLERLYPPGARVLDIGCGTGEDAVWLAKRGVLITAADSSAEMLAQAQRKAELAEVADRIAFVQLDLAHADQWNLPAKALDGAYSNFGALNCVGSWREVGKALEGSIRSGGRIGVAVMGPICPWEVLWHTAHGDLRTATRRWRGQSIAEIEGVSFPVYYPTPRRLARELGFSFHVERVCGLGVFLPPSDVQPVVARRRTLLAALEHLERWAAELPLFNRLGDHYWMELCRT
ncbi:MAG: methyltransferase domain-containing protein [Acidobacteriota bacterium]